VTSVLGWRWILSPSRVFPNDLTSLTGHSARTGHQIPGPVGAGNCVTHRDLVIFADQLQVAFAGDQHLAQALPVQRSAIAFTRGAWSGVLMSRSRASGRLRGPRGS
jgi:hypothetical protein